MQVQAQHRFSVEDYHRMAEAGVLKPHTRVELLDGRITDKSLIGPLHGGMVNRLIRWLRFGSGAARGKYGCAAGFCGCGAGGYGTAGAIELNRASGG